MNYKNRYLSKVSASALAGGLALGFLSFGNGGIAFAAPASNASAGSAKEEGETKLEEVIVTVRRRAESLQDAPVAVTAFTAAALEHTYAQDIRGLAGQIPNVVITNVPGFNAASIGSRGQSTGDIILTFEPAVAVIVDDFVIAHVQTQLLDMFDIERMEMLRGPQGTLFGKNTVGGVLNIVTKKPNMTEAGGEFRISHSSFVTTQVRGAINIPLIDGKLALRVASSYEKSGGYYHFTKGPNADGGRLGGTEVLSTRAKLRWTPDATWDTMLSYEMVRDRSASPPSVNESPASFLFPILGYPGIQDTHGSPYDTGLTMCVGSITSSTCPGTANGHRVDIDGIYLRTEKDVDGVGNFIMSSGYRKVVSVLASDYTGEDANLFVSTRNDTRKQWSIEGRYNSTFSERFNVTLGGMYWAQKDDYASNSILGFLRFLGSPGSLSDPNMGAMTQKVRSFAAFGEGEYKATQDLSLILGARYTTETKDFDVYPQVPMSLMLAGHWPHYVESETSSKPTIRVGYRYKINENINNYFTYSQGFKSAGFNEQAMSANSAKPFKAETADSFEMGFKTQTSDHRLRLNFDGFFVKYNDLQRDAVVKFTDPNTGLPGQETKTTNAGKAQVYGIEAEASAVPIRNLTLTAALGWQKAKYLKFTTDVNGDGINDDASYLKLTRTPEWTVSFGANYEWFTDFGTITANGNINYQSQYESSVLNADFTQGQARTLVAANLSWADKNDRYKVTIFGTNLLNKVYRVSGNSVAGLWNFTNYAPPRSVGAEFGVKF
jgi:iron complex outermembrane receptor protein